MKKLTGLFLTIGKWIALGGAALNVLLIIVEIIFAASNNTFAYHIGTIIWDSICVAMCLVAFFWLIPEGEKGFNSAKCKADAKKPGIMAIVGGALAAAGSFSVGIIAAVAGVFMLIMNDGYYGEEIQTAEVVEDKKEEEK